MGAVKRFIILISIGHLLLCCNEDDTKPLVDNPWKLDSAFTGFNKIVLNTYPIEDNTLAVAGNRTYWFRNGDEPNTSITGFYLPPSIYNLVPPAIGKSIGVVVKGPNTLGLFPTQNGLNWIPYSPTYSNSLNSIKEFPLPTVGTGYPNVRGRYILAPVEIDRISKTGFADLLKVNVSQTAQGLGIQVVSVQKITLTTPPNAIFSDLGYFAQSYGDQFFMTYMAQFFKVDTLGNVQAFGNGPVPGVTGNVDQLFTLEGFLFAKGGPNFFVSTNNGQSWVLFAVNNDFTMLNFCNVNGRTYAYFGWQVFRVELDGETIVITELDNHGLETNQITSINKSGSNVYISTLSGLFYKDSDTWDTLKKE